MEHKQAYLTLISNNKSVPLSCNKSLADFQVLVSQYIS